MFMDLERHKYVSGVGDRQVDILYLKGLEIVSTATIFFHRMVMRGLTVF